MTKQTKKPTARKTTSKKTPVMQLAKRSDFQRWLLPGLLAIAFYLFTGLVSALVIKNNGGVSPENGWLITTLFVITLICVAWWLFESARSIVLYIDRRSRKK